MTQTNRIQAVEAQRDAIMREQQKGENGGC
jgi:hypothetical protein